MFNILIDDCPEVIDISGQYLNIAADFKSILKILSKSENIESKNDVEDILNIFYNKAIPGDEEVAVEALEYFLVCGDEKEEVAKESNENNDEVVEEEKFFDMLYDSNYIFAAFLQVYNIDLTTTSIHWWKFKKMVEGLPNSTKLSEVIEIRSSEMPKDAKSRASISRMKEFYKLPQKDKVDEKKAENTIDALFTWAKS